MRTVFGVRQLEIGVTRGAGALARVHGTLTPCPKIFIDLLLLLSGFGYPSIYKDLSRLVARNAGAISPSRAGPSSVEKSTNQEHSPIIALARCDLINDIKGNELEPPPLHGDLKLPKS